MRIMTHNIWGDYFGNAVDERVNDVINIYQSYTPDVIGFQEVTKSWNDSDLFSYLEKDYSFVGIDRFYSDNYVPIAFKKNLELVAKGFERLGGVPDRSKAISWAVLKRPNGQIFGVCNAHFWFMSGFEPEEKKQGIAKGFGEIAFFTNEQHKNVRADNARQLIALMKRLAKEYGCPVFGIGDMNCTVQSRVFTDVCKSQNIPHLYDLAREKDDICSIHGYPVKTAGRKWQGEMPSKDHTWSIDHMIACGDGFTVQAYRTITDQAALDASDHSCIFADIEFTPNAL